MRHHGRVPLEPDAVDRLSGLVGGGAVAVLSGAGLSTESGIPDYRGPTGAARQVTPMTYQTFITDGVARRRYWARSHLGWGRIARAEPNAGHVAVADLERAGLLSGILTQNVDGLHQRAGTADVLELHGNLARVACLRCGARTSRAKLDDRLRTANAGWSGRAAAVNPDGDVELSDAAAEQFVVVDCLGCGGVLKPDVVFFGESVPPDRVAAAFALVDRSRALLVLGSSLTVMSGRRFVLRAAALGTPVAIVNQGATRGDAHAGLVVGAPLGAVLPAVVARTLPVPRMGSMIGGTAREGLRP